MDDLFYSIFIYPIKLLIETVFQMSYKIFENCGVSIAATSLAVSFLSLPLYIAAERWQQKERDIQHKFKTKVDEIKAVFKGDEQHMILSTFYRQNHYHPVMALRSSISLMIQIPFFIASYVFLSNLEILRGQSFWIIQDLSSADQLLNIHGIIINVLPVVMTIINIAAGAVYTKGFSAKEKIQSYGMAGIFLVLLYNSPAGLVFYWMLNNVFSLLKNIVYKIHFSFSDLFYNYLLKIKHLFGKLLCPLLTDNKDRRIIFFLSCSVFLLLAGIIIPSSLICSSVQEFSFIEPFKNPVELLRFPFMQALGIVAWFIALYFLFSNKTQTVFSFLFFVGMILALIDVYLFSGNYGTVLIDNGLVFENGINIRKELIKIPLDACVFFIIVGVSFFIVYKGKIAIIKNLFAITVMTLIVFFGFNFFKINSDFSKYEKINMTEKDGTEGVLKPVYHLSRTEKNVVVIMLDRAINSFFPIITEEMPEVKKQFAGFTYYPNTVSPGNFTVLAAPALFGGYDYLPEKINIREDEPLVKKHNESLEVLPRFFCESGFDVVITDASLANYSWIPDNSIFRKYDNVHALNLGGRYDKIWKEKNNIKQDPKFLSDLLKRNFLFFDFFRMSPVCLRGIVYDHGKWWSSLKKEKSKNNELIKWYSLLDYLPDLTSFDAKGKTFTVMVNNMTHEPSFLQYPEYVLKENITDTGENIFDDEMTFKHYHVNAGAIKMVGKWLDWLRDNDVYDNTRIIIVSDHGRDIVNKFIKTDYDRVTIAWFNSLFLFKDFNDDEPVKRDDSFMTIADVPFLASKNIVSYPVNPFTGNLFEDHLKEKGILTVKGSASFDKHNKNTLNFDSEYHVEKDIFKAENWEKIK